LHLNSGGVVRIKIQAYSEKPVFIPFNYQYQLSAAIYNLIGKSSGEYAEFLHDTGFRYAKVHKKPASDGTDIRKIYKLFTFSKLFFTPHYPDRYGFPDVRTLEFIFSTPVPESYKHTVLGVFADNTIRLDLFGQNLLFSVSNVESLPEPVFTGEHSFICLSPIAVSTSRDTPAGDREPHFIDYLQPEERLKFEENIQRNLIRKYQALTGKTIRFSKNFTFAFDLDYIVRRQGNISKLIHFKDDVRIKAFEAPFTIIAKPELIQTGYTCGFGEKNSDGFGCAEMIRTDAD